MTATMNEKTFASWKESYDKSIQNIKKQRHHFADKGTSSQGYVFFPVVMYGYESWTIKLSAKELILSQCGAGEDS